LLETVGGSRGGKAENRGQGSEVGKGLLITDCGVLVPKEPKMEHVIEAVEWMTPQGLLGCGEGVEERAKQFDTNVFLPKKWVM